MTLRVVVAAVLATALVATSLPAVETARRGRSAARVEADIDRLETAVADLRAREQATASGAGARRVVTVRVPARDRTHAGVDYVAVGGRPDTNRSDAGAAAFAWRVAGGVQHTRRVPGIPVVAGESGDSEPLVLARPGTHRLSVRLTRRRGEAVAVVRRVD